MKEKYCNNEYEESDHGKYEAANKYVEDSCHMGKAQLALCRCLLLLLALRSVVPPSGDQQFDFVLAVDELHLFFSFAKSPFSVRLRTAMLMMSFKPVPLAVAIP